MVAKPLFPVQPWEMGVAAAAGVTLSQFRFMLSFLLSIVAGAALRYVPSSRGRHWFSALSGLFLLLYPFGLGVLHALATALLTYVFMLRFRNHCGTLTWLVVFPYLIACHVLSASGMAWKEGHMDFTGAQMVATLKLIAAAMSYQDGLRVSQEDEKHDGSAGGAGVAAGGGGGSASGAVQHGGSGHGSGGHSQSKHLEALPSLLEFLSYVFAFGNLLAGPFFELRDYLDYIGRMGDWDARDPKKRIPSPLLPGLARLGKGLALLAVWSQLVGSYSPDLMESEWWGTVPVWKRAAVMWLVGFTSRCKYYFAWAWAEASLIFSGLCFNGYAEDAKGRPRTRWTRYINARIRRVELSTSWSTLVGDWNICTGTWLRRYVYERLTPPGKRPTFRTLVVTQTVSGIWHGLFPGYWLFFVTSAVFLEASRVLYRYEQGWAPRLRSFPLWTAAKVLLTAFTLNYAAAAFQILSFRESIAAWRSVYFSGHLIMLLVLLVGAVLPPKRRRERPHVTPQPATGIQGAGGGGTAAAGEGVKAE